MAFCDVLRGGSAAAAHVGAHERHAHARTHAHKEQQPPRMEWLPKKRTLSDVHPAWKIREGKNKLGIVPTVLLFERRQTLIIMNGAMMPHGSLEDLGICSIGSFCRVPRQEVGGPLRLAVRI